MTRRINYGFTTWAVETLAEVVARDVATMASGEVLELVFNDGPGFTVYYDEEQARGDDGHPVRGDVTGEFEVRLGIDGPIGLVRVTDVHVGPHGTSGYGNAAAKGHACRQVGLAIARRAEITALPTSHGGTA